jgi:hypothetical protein
MPWRRAIAVWLGLVGAEIVHGILRSIVLLPRVGDKRARQIGVFTGSLVNLGITHFFSGGLVRERPVPTLESGWSGWC